MEVRKSRKLHLNLKSPKLKEEEKPSSSPKDCGPAICKSFLRNDCELGDKCFLVHSSEPYQWQFLADDGNWISFPANLNLDMQKEDTKEE
jgi:hypothetical protein